MALCDAFRWNVEVAYLGGQSKDEVNFVKIPDTPHPGFEPVVLLYRCAHQSFWSSEIADNMVDLDTTISC